ncbi:hypothetical protein CHLNCDRAFT_133811 [Chlorella variabilis]|uniref:Disease resistance R13L4/SHOC-2-like LRR domain-containing protein n=1 Tax=Chlorella variabilis TaxID=554065 RepID=E1ZFA3_CHLVA|nr:hypothetical protein CHLNCDRAFT_133811 [Chlorella variabilis]EFN55465.1 hypothetical protein CHLNCDRAFT_133811 [Chlorella variabilis]|eukprot:XP_005847567.1 hypothetical protein CHLNCDRAFT_133811 [Chlorella variabilis]
MSSIRGAGQAPASPLLAAPDDVLGFLARLLPVRDRQSLAATCTRLRRASLLWFPTVKLSRLPEDPAEAALVAAWLCERHARAAIEVHAGREEEGQLALIDGLAALRSAPVVSLQIFAADADLPSDFLAGYKCLVDLYWEWGCMEGSWRAISHLTQLQRLSLVEVGMERLPRGVLNLQALTYLDVNGSLEGQGGCQHLAALTQLQELVLGYCGLTQLPTALSRLTALRILSLSGNHVQSGFQHLAPLSWLEELDLTPGEQLPAVLSQLTALTSLTIFGDDITLANGWQHLEPLRRLEDLHLICCLHEQLPPSLSRLATLTSILIDSNTHLRHGWQHLPAASLQRLDLDVLTVEEVPVAFSRLTSLTALMLHHCSLDGGWHHLWPLRHLRQLVAAGCPERRLTEVPEELSQLTGLTSLAWN